MSDPDNPDIYFCDPPAAIQQGAVEFRDLTRERSNDYDLPNSPNQIAEQPSLPPEQRPAPQRRAEARVPNKRTYCDAKTIAIIGVVCTIVVGSFIAVVIHSFLYDNSKLKVQTTFI